MAGHVVTAAAVRVVVGASALIVEQGGRLPDGVTADDLKRLVTKGMIAKSADPDPDPAEPGPRPDGDGPKKGLDDMTLDELRAYAKEHEINLEGATLKPEVLDKIKAAQA